MTTASPVKISDNELEKLVEAVISEEQDCTDTHFSVAETCPDILCRYACRYNVRAMHFRRAHATRWPDCNYNIFAFLVLYVAQGVYMSKPQMV